MNDVSNRAVREFSELLSRIEANFPKPTCTTAYEITMKSTRIQQRAWRGTQRCYRKRYPQWPRGNF